MSAPLLSVRDLRVTIATPAGEVNAVDGISFNIAPGRTLGLVGESGSGKSMTAMSLLGLAPAGTRITSSGQATFEGTNLLRLDEAALRTVRGRRIGVVFQDPAAALDPLMMVGEQIREALPAAMRCGAGWRDRLAGLLAEVGLDDILQVHRRYPHELSGGQQQRVVIAMALAADPALLVADEPTTALDMSVQGQILELLDRLRQARGMSMLLITHDLGIVARHADDVLVLRQGRMVEAGPTQQVMQRPRNDYTRVLVQSRPRLGQAAERPAAVGSVLLGVEALSVSYPGPHLLSRRNPAVADIAFSVQQGEAVGIVGESGSGKSTLAKALVGLVRADGGRTSFRQAPLDPWRMRREQRRHIQYIFQDSYGALNPRMTVEQAVGEPLAIAGLPRRQRRAVVLGLLEEVGLDERYLSRLPRELSGGQRQRVNIARALAVSPELLICDEIVSALDVAVQAQVLALLKQLQVKRGLSIIFISHDLAVVGDLCHRVLVMRHGAIVEQGHARDVLRTPMHPYTRELLTAARSLATPVPVEAQSEGLPWAGMPARGGVRLAYPMAEPHGLEQRVSP